MRISESDWVAYINRLSKIDKAAANAMKAYVEKYTLTDLDFLIDYAYSIATKYGEAAAALAAEMYDATAVASGALIPAAEVAETATYTEVAKTVRGVTNWSQNPDSVSNAVSRLVKRAGADTMLKNAERDGAQFAWIPHGETCAFCLTLASNGWQYMSKSAMKGGHAEHIHANCDCTYAVRFDDKTKVEGYNPDVYKKIYYDAEGSTPQQRINSMRREIYAENKDEINAQKREAYALRNEETGQ